jgi:hypothetical protein
MSNSLKPISAIFVMIMLTLVVPTAIPVKAQSDTIPPSYVIKGVPEFQQQTATGCGAASLEMVFGYYQPNPIISQKQIYDAARTRGTTLPDMARAAQFSNLSTTVGTAFPAFETTGYTGRSLGYAGFYYASTTSWLPELEAIVAQGYPVIVLVHWMPGTSKTDLEEHYRVVVGYDTTKGVVMTLDPWSRELKKDMGIHGSTSSDSNGTKGLPYDTINFTASDFLATWNASTDIWGTPGLAYGAVLVSPWQVTIGTSATAVTTGVTFQVTATITYPAPAPFGSAAFPTFSASNFGVMIKVGSGLVASGPTPAPPTTLNAGDTVTETWNVFVGGTSGTPSINVTATGLVSGSLGPWYIWPAYSYTDRIGGTASATVSIT